MQERLDVGAGAVVNYVKIAGSTDAEKGSVVLLHGFGTGLAVWATSLRVCSYISV